MKKIFCLISCLIITLILICVTPNNVKASEETWYQTAADNANNPVLLEDKQYYQGVSINSHLISDLTFMEIPFINYLTESDKKIQIITFSEAMYLKNGEIQKEVVMYVYYPDNYNGNNTIIYTDINLINQKVLVGEEYIESLSDNEKSNTYRFRWQSVSNYGNIVKYSFSSTVSIISNDKVISEESYSINEWLLKEVGGNPNINEVITVFDANISCFYCSKGYIFNNENVANNFYINQQFQFVNCKQNPLAEAGIMLMTNTEPTYEHISACVATNTNTVSVEGETVKYRYTMDQAKNIEFLKGIDYFDGVDVHYLFFNVIDNQTNIKWGIEKYITQVRLNYAEAILTQDVKCNVNLFGNDDWTYSYRLDYVNSSGKIVKNDSNSFVFTFDTSDSETAEKCDKQVFDEIIFKFLNNINDKELYKEDVITPDEVTFEYIANSKHNTWVLYTAGLYDTRKVTYKTLFNTKSEEFLQILDESSELSDELINKYQFGLVFGNKQGYQVTKNSNFVDWTSTSSVVSTLAGVIGVIDIEYKENGEAHRVTVSENTIDNSNVTKPNNQDEDPWVDIPGTPRPKKETGNWFWDFIQKIINFFAITLPNWWNENQTALIGILITAGIVVVGIFLWRLLSPAITAAKVKKAVQDEKKKE